MAIFYLAFSIFPLCTFPREMLLRVAVILLTGLGKGCVRNR
jgi:hypothetical protein